MRGMDHGLEILSRLKARAFFALAAGQPVAKDGDIPILVFNPHPWDIDADIACEFNLPDQNREGHVHPGDRDVGRTHATDAGRDRA